MPQRVTIIKGSISALIVRLIAAIFLIESVYAVALIGSALLSSETAITTQLIIFLWVVHTVKFFATAYLVIRIITEMLSHKSYLTEQRLVVDSGILTIDEEVYQLDQLKNLTVHQNPLGQRLGYGSLELKFGARSFEKTIVLPYITSPHKYAEMLETHLKE